MLTYNNLFASVLEEIIKYSSYPSTSSWKDQLSKSLVLSPVSLSASSVAVDSSNLATTLHELLAQLLPATITSGLSVSATDPATNQIIISAGTGMAGGKIFTLKTGVTIDVPFDNSTTVFFVHLYVNGIQIEREEQSSKLLLARVIVPKPGTTSRVQDIKDDENPWDAYIVGRKEYKLYGDDYGNFEEDSIEILRQNIGEVLAENLIGNIRLSENLKIINTAGTVELDSNSLKIKNEDSVLMAKFNRNGVYFYDRNTIELARFTSTDARVGNILITKNSLQSSNFLTGSLGFQIKDDGNVEFNNIEVRGIIYATAGEIGGWTIASNSLYGTTTGTIKTSVNAGAGYNGVVLDVDGLRVYNDVLGEVVDLPSDGSAPTFSSGIIRETIYEINTNSVIRTSENVGVIESNTNLLINFDGNDGDTTYTAETGQVVTFEGTAQLDTAQKKFGASSLLLDGDSDYVTVPDSDDWSFGTGDFTVECWVKLNALSTSQRFIGQFYDDTSLWRVGINDSNQLFLVFVSGNTKGLYLTSDAAISDSDWHHVVFERYGTGAFIFVDGVSKSLTASTVFGTNDVGNVNAPLSIGKAGSMAFFNGWIGGIRISKRIARFIDDFTPPTSAYGYLDKGILINNTGIYGCAKMQTLSEANLKALIDGTIRLKGEILALSGMIGNVTITENGLYGGYIETSLIRANVIETSSTTPRVRIDSDGIIYQEATNIAKYGSSGNGGYGFKYGSGTRYGTGVAAYIFKSSYPMFNVAVERNYADFHYYHREEAPSLGTHNQGDTLFVNGLLNFCYTAGAPGIFIPVSGLIENRADDTGCTQSGRIWLRTDL